MSYKVSDENVHHEPQPCQLSFRSNLCLSVSEALSMMIEGRLSPPDDYWLLLTADIVHLFFVVFFCSLLIYWIDKN